MCFSYCELCSNILSSVRKMEDNILRLKRVRESSKNLPQTATTAGTTEISDDNKIRKQIQHDVDAFSSEVIDLFFTYLHEIFLLVG